MECVREGVSEMFERGEESNVRERGWVECVREGVSEMCERGGG